MAASVVAARRVPGQSRRGAGLLLAFAVLAALWPVASARVTASSREVSGDIPRLVEEARARRAQGSGGAAAVRPPANLTSIFALGLSFVADVSSSLFASDLAVDAPIKAAIGGILDGLDAAMVQLDGIDAAVVLEGAGDRVSIRLFLQLRSGAEQTRVERGALQIQPSVLARYLDVELERAGLIYSILAVSGMEVVPLHDVCTQDDCLDGYIPIEEVDLPATCHGPVCTSAECCNPLDRCHREYCTIGYVLKSSGPGGTLPSQCRGAVCMRHECCDVAAICDSSVCGAGTTPKASLAVVCEGRQCREEECCDGPTAPFQSVPVECMCPPEYVVNSSLQRCAASFAEPAGRSHAPMPPCDETCCQLSVSGAGTSPSGDATTKVLIIVCFCAGVLGLLLMFVIWHAMRYPPRGAKVEQQQSNPPKEGGDVEEAEFLPTVPSRCSESAEAKIARAFDVGLFNSEPACPKNDVLEDFGDKGESPQADLPAPATASKEALLPDTLPAGLPAPPTASREAPSPETFPPAEIAIEQSELAPGPADSVNIQPPIVDQAGRQVPNSHAFSYDALPAAANATSPQKATESNAAQASASAAVRREVVIETVPAGCCGGGSPSAPPSMWHGLLCCSSPPQPLASTMPAEGGGAARAVHETVLSEGGS